MMNKRVQDAADAVRAACGEADVGLILGSGLADSIDLEDARTIAYGDIPLFLQSTTAGHKNEWVSGRIGRNRVCMMRGRFHYYEGYTPEDIVLPIRVMKTLGVKTLIVTNAAGGIHPDFHPGDLMVIQDHINFCGVNPLVGPNDDAFGIRFPDMTHAYDPELAESAHACAQRLGISLQDGVYIWMSGPSFETPAEIRMARALGADAVGMSTVPEVIAARHCGIRVLGISCITNMAAGILDQPLTHAEVTKTGQHVKHDFAELITSVITTI